ncbi:MAG: ferrous iron transporter B [Parvularculaceae bacterium]|uniref:ferrous iron transporter B n=1 Tax=Methylocystis sp. TaxID=1911079 RepID=UPI003D09E9EF
MTALRLALVGAPNCGKSTLFNGLTGGRAKVANYPGVTVETRSGRFRTPGGRDIELIDLPGFYGMTPRSMDERVALDLLTGKGRAAPPNLLLVLIDAANLRTHLHSVLQLRALGLPMIVALNMIDLAKRDGLELDVGALEERLGVPVVTTQATRKSGREALVARIDKELGAGLAPSNAVLEAPSLPALQKEARAIARAVVIREPMLNRVTRLVDKVVLNQVVGPFVLATLLFFIFQAVFSWSAAPMDAIDAGAVALGDFVRGALPQGWLRSLLVDGVIAGVGSVVIFLPQILILFAFILFLEASGYMARAAFLMDELMMRVGLNGRAFIPLLSSFACAIPGIMAARVIESERDRLTTILIAPLMTCSARLPVYTLIIAAFIPPLAVGPFNLQGLVMFGLYIVGVISAVAVAFVLKRTVAKGAPQPLILELPTYKLPNARDYVVGLATRASAFLKRAGTIILGTSIVLWFLASYPASATSLAETFAGRIGALLAHVLRPVGFNLEIAIALIPGMAAREVAVSALGTVYAIQGTEENIGSLAGVLRSAWSLPTALAFLAWYVFAPQCMSTLATIKRETNSWKWAGFAFAYLIVLAYAAAGVVYHVAVSLVG